MAQKRRKQGISWKRNETKRRIGNEGLDKEGIGREDKGNEMRQQQKKMRHVRNVGAEEREKTLGRTKEKKKRKMMSSEYKIIKYLNVIKE